MTQPPQMPPPHYPYLAPTNTYAILSLVLGLAVFPPLGIWFGYRAKQQIAETGERGIELAKAGIICGWIFSLLMVVWCAFMGIIVFSDMG